LITRLKEEPRPGELYRHFKTKNIYVVLDVGNHTENKERLVSYTEINSPINKEPYKRPLEMFMTYITNYDHKFHRFEKVNPFLLLESLNKNEKP